MAFCFKAIQRAVQLNLKRQISLTAQHLHPVQISVGSCPVTTWSHLPLLFQISQVTNLRAAWPLGGSGACTRSFSAKVQPTPDTTLYLRNLDNGAEIFLVGTAHVSRKSAEQVQQMIQVVKPEVVMLELDATRARKLRSQSTSEQGSFLKDFLAHMGMPGAAFSESLLKAGMSGFYHVLRTLGLDPGLEFKVAIEEAERTGARLVYGDQDAQVTMKRLTQALGGPNGLTIMDLLRLMVSNPSHPIPPDLYQLLKGGLSSSLEARVEAMKNRQMARSMTQYMRDVHPKLAQALIDERDEIMVDCLRGLRGKVVAVVGLAHLDGIESRWQAAGATAKIADN
ncbi:hypothetical protein WJX72_010357 [[Myrmecia] bisecta]|uniref:TraB domain-containing protein n=1 Tax=[Myrmecia] bisecta TaxID=41462 RepID=A0AAW1PX66_9CHLO